MYELKKFIFNKRNVGVFGFLVFFLVCFIGYNVYMDKHYNESQIKIYQKAYRISENRMDEAGSEEESEFWKKVYRNASGMIHFYYNINVNLKMYSFDHLRMYNIDHINTCCSRR